MIYLEETLNLIPASSETLDTLVGLAQEQLLPACQRLGSRLVAAWYTDVYAFSQVMQVLEFDNLEAFEMFRTKAGQDPAWREYESLLQKIAPERCSRLLEPLGPVLPEVLHEAAAQSQQSPLGVYTMAVLEVAPGKMPEFIALIEAAAERRPGVIVASWRTIVGKQNEVTDIWNIPLRQSGYEPADEATRQSLGRLREIAPRERLLQVFTLPYSPLR